MKGRSWTYLSCGIAILLLCPNAGAGDPPPQQSTIFSQQELNSVANQGWIDPGEQKNVLEIPIQEAPPPPEDQGSLTVSQPQGGYRNLRARWESPQRAYLGVITSDCQVGVVGMHCRITDVCLREGPCILGAQVHYVEDGSPAKRAGLLPYTPPKPPGRLASLLMAGLMLMPAAPLVTPLVISWDQGNGASGDVIVACNLKRVRSSRDLTRLLGQFKPGDTVELSVIRMGEREVLHIPVRLDAPPDRGMREQAVPGG